MLPSLTLALALPLHAGPSLFDTEGRPHPLPSPPGMKATVYFFLLPDCPIANYYGPEIRRVCADYRGKKVAAFVVHCDPDVTAAQARGHARDYRFTCPVLLDPTHALARAVGATKAPEAVVVGPDGKVAYRGRIDDTYVDYGKRRLAPTRRDLRLALDAVLAGKPVPTPKTAVIGCDLPEPKK